MKLKFTPTSELKDRLEKLRAGEVCDTAHPQMRRNFMELADQIEAEIEERMAGVIKLQTP